MGYYLHVQDNLIHLKEIHIDPRNNIINRYKIIASLDLQENDGQWFYTEYPYFRYLHHNEKPFINNRLVALDHSVEVLIDCYSLGELGIKEYLRLDPNIGDVGKDVLELLHRYRYLLNLFSTFIPTPLKGTLFMSEFSRHSKDHRISTWVLISKNSIKRHDITRDGSMIDVYFVSNNFNLPMEDIRYETTYIR